VSHKKSGQNRVYKEKRTVREKTPSFLKVVYRLVVYKSERKKQWREVGIRSVQDRRLKETFSSDAGRLIIFIAPGADWDTGKDKISGGILSIVSLCEETARLKDVHGAESVLCTPRGEHLLVKYEMFENKTPVFRFAQLPLYFHKAEQVMIHLPEFMAGFFIGSLNKKEVSWLQQVKQLHINILNQNIAFMPGKPVIDALRDFSDKLTITTAHQKYCNHHFRELYSVPLHKFSVWISPENYLFTRWQAKEQLLVVSPDQHEMKELVLDKLLKIPGLKVQVIANLTYEQYKALIARAKWSLTFGEGLDGYFIEPVFSGAVAFAVYNQEFFTEDFKPLVYASYQDMADKIVHDIERLDNAMAFEPYQRMQFERCAFHYSYAVYRDNIRSFYEGNYTIG
jgi:hypothetical protein